MAFISQIESIYIYTMAQFLLPFSPNFIISRLICDPCLLGGINRVNKVSSLFPIGVIIKAGSQNTSETRVYKLFTGELYRKLSGISIVINEMLIDNRHVAVDPSRARQMAGERGSSRASCRRLRSRNATRDEKPFPSVVGRGEREKSFFPSNPDERVPTRRTR